jgi:N-hydroxyarylamine O-acetyltransferase
MTDGIDLDSYLRQIGYDGPRAPSLELLRELQFKHALSIPFENLDPLLRRPVPLDLPSLGQKLLSGRRGGYCFEQNRLFQAALAALGFEVTGLLARVRWNIPEGVQVPRTHMLLRVAIDGEDWIADVGFGGQTPTGPLRLATEMEQATPHEPFRLRRDGDGFLLQGLLGGEWRPLYRFDLQPQTPADYEMGNWYTSTHPRSRFLNNLVASRPTADRRYALLNREFAVHRLGGPSERRELADAREVRRVLEEVFGVTPPDDPELDATIARLPGPART